MLYYFCCHNERFSSEKCSLAFLKKKNSLPPLPFFLSFSSLPPPLFLYFSAFLTVHWGSISMDRPPTSPQGHPPSRRNPGPEIVTLRTFTLCSILLLFHLFLFISSTHLHEPLHAYFCVVIWRSFITGRQCRKLLQEERQEIKESEWWIITLDLFPLRHALLEYLEYRLARKHTHEKKNRQNNNITRKYMFWAMSLRFTVIQLKLGSTLLHSL